MVDRLKLQTLAHCERAQHAGALQSIADNVCQFPIELAAPRPTMNFIVLRLRSPHRCLMMVLAPDVTIHRFIFDECQSMRTQS
jgi:hypothetical protein